MHGSAGSGPRLIQSEIFGMSRLAALSSLPFAEARAELGMFGSYQRTEAMVHIMLRAPTPAEAVAVFLDWGCMCDAPWPWRSVIADILRRRRARQRAVPSLSPGGWSVRGAAGSRSASIEAAAVGGLFESSDYRSSVPMVGL